MLQLVEGPARAESVLRIGGFPEVELRPLDSLDVESLDDLQLTASPVDDDDRPVPRADDDTQVTGGYGTGVDDDPVLVADGDVEGWER